MNSVNHLGDYQVIEFRRYTIKPGEREHFIQYFEAFFPEAMEQLGALVLGQFAERENASHFLWLRGFHSTFERRSRTARSILGRSGANIKLR